MTLRSYEADGLELGVPDDWKEHRRGDELRFDAPDGDEQLIVQLLHARSPMDRATREIAATELFDARCDSLAELSDASGTILPSEVTFDDARTEITFVGRDPSHEVLMHGRIVVGSLRIAIASYYRYGAAEPSLDFTQRAQSVCASVRITEP